MNWEDEGYIISKNKFRENNIILDVFTSNYGKVSGIVYGGNSRKIRNYLQLFNKIFTVYSSKGENRIGYFKTEIIEPVAPTYFNDKLKILSLNSLSSILKSLLPENQSYKRLYNSLEKLLKDFNKPDWLVDYIMWEINFIKNLGYGFDLNPDNFEKYRDTKTVNVKLDNVDYKIPSFLIFHEIKNYNKQDIYNGLVFSRNLMENKFFFPNNLRLPYSRKMLELKVL